MSGKTAAGSVLIVVGIAIAAWGIKLANRQLAGATGMYDNTSSIAIFVGIAFFITGLLLAVVSKDAYRSH
jgi:preprotein translocase subunit SecG